MAEHLPYGNTEKEYEAVKKFLTRVQDIPGCDNNWDVSRLNWWRYNYHAQKDVSFFNENAHCWMDDNNEVIGLFISEYGKNDFFIVPDPSCPNLLEDMIHWVETVWARKKSEISTYVFDFDTNKTAKLEELGYDKVRHENNVRYYDLTHYDFSYKLKPGFEILTFREFGDLLGRIELVKNAFNIESYPKERLLSLQSSPQYIPELDLIAVNAEGQGAAYCMGWVEEHDKTLGYIEPMGTHSDYRRLGLASSLAKECFGRLAALGVKTATIASNAEPDISNFLYDSLKPVKKKRGFEYKKLIRDSEK